MACCWSFEIPQGCEPFRHAIIPDGMVSLVVNSLRLVVRGPCATAAWVTLHPGDTFRGVRLLPGASSALLGVPARSLLGRSEPLTAFNPQLAQDLGRCLAGAGSNLEVFAAIDRLLAPLAACAPPVDPIIRSCVTELTRSCGNARIGELAQEARISERQLRRRFLSVVGLSPKQLSRLIRVRAACIHVALFPQASLAGIAQEAGYADQAHLSREFAAVFGSPARGLSALIRGYAHGRFQSLPAS